jgi:hypothetical protein
MREGEALPIQRYPMLTEAAVAEMMAALHQAAKEKSWPEPDSRATHGDPAPCRPPD